MAEIRQLRGLAERMDEDAFLPFRGGNFSPELPRRLLDLRRVYEQEWVGPINSTGTYRTSAYTSGYGQ